MGGLKPIGSEKLQGMDKIQRIIEIARYNENVPTPVNENKNTEYTLKLADGNVYAIVKEKLGYIIKSAINESETDYIEPIRERKYHKSYSEALKRLNLMAKEMNTLYGNKKGVSLFEQDEKKKDKQYFLKVPNTNKKETSSVKTEELDEQVDPTDPTTQVPAAAPAIDPTATPATPAIDPTATPADPTMMGTDEIPAEELDMDMEEPNDELDGGKDEKKEEVTFKTIQKLTGRLSQKIRKYTEEEDMTSDDTKYIINSILSSLDLEVLDDEDVDEIIDRLEGEEDENEENGNDDIAPEDEMGGSVEPGLEGAPMAPEETQPTTQPELGEGYGNLSDAFTEKFKGAFTSNVADQMMEDDYPKHGAAGKRHRHLTNGTFGESKVDKIISSYFKINENEILIKEDENRKKIETNVNKLTKKIKLLSESIPQERASLKFIEQYPKSELLGKSKAGNLLFQTKNKNFRISTDGKLI